MNDQFNLFLESVDEGNQAFVASLHEYLTKNNCKCEIKEAKSGYVVSYLYCDTKKTIANFVFRKAGIRIRIYPEHISEYQEFLNCLPEKMKCDIKDAPVCKRLINSDDCNPKCAMGYVFELDGETYQKCRYSAFMPPLHEKNNPMIQAFLEKELSHHH